MTESQGWRPQPWISVLFISLKYFCHPGFYIVKGIKTVWITRFKWKVQLGIIGILYIIHFLKIDPKGSICRKNTIGSNMKPCDMPHEMTAEGRGHIHLSVLTEADLSWMSEANHWKACPWMPITCSRPFKRMEWLTMPKAVGRSKRIQAKEFNVIFWV